jgi:AraC family transcriptional regulator
LTTTELASAAHLSRFQFIRLFKAVHGITPYQYVQRKRALIARRLLETTALSHEDVAARVGFDHRSTLFRQLVRWTGCSGRELRDRSRLGRATS